MNYNNKKFKVVNSTENGEVSSSLVFHYEQEGSILFCSYSDKTIIRGQLLGTVDSEGNIDMSYQQINSAGILMTGLCKSSPEILANGKIRLRESWQWTSGDQSRGHSILEEI